MQNETHQPNPSRPVQDNSEQLRPPVTRWNLPAPRLQGVRFQSPVAAITTVNSPLRPSRLT